MLIGPERIQILFEWTRFSLSRDHSFVSIFSFLDILGRVDVHCGINVRDRVTILCYFVVLKVINMDELLYRDR